MAVCRCSRTSRWRGASQVQTVADMVWQPMTERPAVVHRTTCRMCDSRELVEILKLEATPPGDHYVTADRLAQPQPVYPMTLVLCARCGLAQLPDVVDPEILYRDYIY